ncbi:MAG: thymidylate kinase [Planctomycetaceae bacterium]
MLVAIEGIDGSGKGTQAALLRDRLEQSGRSAALISFPRYEHTAFGRAIGDFLNGRFGPLDAVSPFLASLLYAGDRFESRPVLDEALRTNDVVVLDRYVASNIAHQGAKLEQAEREELRQFIERIEYDVHQLPRPDLTLWLDVPAEVAQRLIARKPRRNYTDKPADLQEADGGYLGRVRAVYRELAGTETNWQRIDCLHGGALRPVDVIAADVWSAVSVLGEQPA